MNTFINAIKAKLKQEEYDKDTLKPLNEMGLVEDNEMYDDYITEKSNVLKTIMSIFLVILLIFCILWVCAKYQDNKPGMTSVNLVCEEGMSMPAFLNYKFTPELTTAIKDGDIELYGIYAYHTQGYEIECKLVETKEAVSGTVEKLKIVKIEYIKYTDEYLDTYFSKEHVEEMRKEGRDGYWEYTIDIIN